MEVPMEQRLYFTPRGLEKQRRKVEQLDQELRRWQRSTAEAAEVGGNQYHDNASYEFLVLQIRTVNIRLGEELRILDRAELVDIPDQPKWVQVGTSVDVEVDGVPETWHIVGYGESDWDRRRISYAAPIAKLLIGARIGELRSDLHGSERRTITIRGVGPLKESI
jgi:transcription elongation GreA/GreB family factor